MPQESFHPILWIIIVSIIVAAYIISLLLSREEKIMRTPPSHHLREPSILHEQSVEDIKLESEKSGSKESYRRSGKEAKEDKLIDSLPRESSDEEAKEEIQEEGLGKILKDDTMEEDTIKEPMLEIIIEEDGEIKLGDFTKTAQELKEELHKLRKILEGER
ncbi:MAG: hypothetical protein LZ172_03505 [Thaumarchaeota archaeon]|jgi:hypothetical protein|nr:hypothetical protein [Candidatus Geocrenenecus arthurdayi]MCL7402494.1 hypothetical protein [Candidatus Geocrenenecus arthurdayi]MCL7403398.1 hypothetical protein [Candidatus Geocrenenecus arthurdayi]